MAKDAYIRKFITAYVDCALWSSIAVGAPDMEENGDTSMESYGYTPDDIAPITRVKLLRDCIAFYREHEDMLHKHGTMERHGHDYWLTRNHHGAGFWDRGYPSNYSKKLTVDSHSAGSLDLYVGDDGLIYCS